MIAPKDRFWVTSEAIMGDLHIGNVIDWDQRRCYTIRGSTNVIPAEEDINIDILKRHIDQLGQRVHSFTVDDEGRLVSVSSAPEDDETFTFHSPRYAACPSLQDCSTISLSQLTELDRLGPHVDLVSYADDSGIQRKTVFKYSIIPQRREWIWNELHLTKSLPKHPNLIHFDRVVVDDAESRVLGFTIPYIPGGTFDENKTRVFRLLWLQQLLAVVDYLNLELGVAHQDVASTRSKAKGKAV